jgi:hypothetical protein
VPQDIAGKFRKNGVARFSGKHPDPAVSGDLGGDSLPDFRSHGWTAEYFQITVTMDVYKPGAQHQVAAIDARGIVDAQRGQYGSNPVGLDHHIRTKRCGCTAIDHYCVGEHHHQDYSLLPSFEHSNTSICSSILSAFW